VYDQSIHVHFCKLSLACHHFLADYLKAATIFMTNVAEWVAAWSMN